MKGRQCPICGTRWRVGERVSVLLKLSAAAKQMSDEKRCVCYAAIIETLRLNSEGRLQELKGKKGRLCDTLDTNGRRKNENSNYSLSNGQENSYR